LDNSTLRFLLTALGAVLMSIAPAPVATASDKETEELISIDKKMQSAFVDRDIATLEKILAEDYVLVLSSGTERTKAEVLADVASPDNQWEINETSDWNVRVPGNTAIVVVAPERRGPRQGV
jgi:acyl-CoA synthetase (AMP-forming)/AMP-acid ligase II